MKSVASSIAFSVSSSFPAAFAQDRFYLWSEQFEREAPGEIGLESYSDFNTPRFSKDGHYLNQQFEIEYSISDRTVIDVNQAFGKQYPGGNSSFGQFGIEGLYRLVFPGRFIVDPVIYIEYSRMWNLSSSSNLETKLILTRDFGPLNAIVNCTVEYQSGTASELEPEFSGGVSCEFARWVRGGLEILITGTDSDRLPDADLRGTGAGPTFSFSTSWFRITSGVSYGIANGANRLDFRTIAGIDF